MISDPWTIIEGDGPLIAVSLHSGHDLRDELAPLIALDEAARLREEDPFTDQWTTVAPTRVLVHRSRFEVDLNRPREKAVYQRPEDACGLHIWSQPLPTEARDRSLGLHGGFYADVRRVFNELAARHGRFLVLDIHSYNHRRGGPDAPPADPKDNPEVNLGTGTMDRQFWAPVVERFVADLRSQETLGRHLDVREKVKFQGGNLSRWTHTTYPRAGCSLAIEFRKDFMDEWTGTPFPRHIESIRRALCSAAEVAVEALDSLP